MVLKVNLEKAIHFTKLSVRLAYCWPPPSNSTKWQNNKFDVLWTLSLLSAVGLLGPLLYSIYEFQSDSLNLTKSACFLGAVSGFIIKIVVCRIHRKRIQGLIFEMEHFVKNAEAHEREVLQRYVDRCSLLHATITIVNYMTTSFVICGPFLLPDAKLPTPAVYPFPVDSGPMMYLVYAHQSYVGFQCSVGATIDCQVALLVWYVGARLEILALELEKVNDRQGLRSFVQKHQQLLRLAHEAKDTMAYIAMTTTTMSGIGTVFSCLQLVGNQPIAVKMQFGPVALISVACLFVCAWPADNLIKVEYIAFVFLLARASERMIEGQCGFVGTSVYNCPWFDMSPSTMKNVLMILQRSQRPVVTSIGGFLPALSLRYYASFLSASFSYFTTLRITVNVDDP